MVRSYGIDLLQGANNATHQQRTHAHAHTRCRQKKKKRWAISGLSQRALLTCSHGQLGGSFRGDTCGRVLQKSSGFKTIGGILVSPATIKGRGAADNPANRFEKCWTERDPEWNSEEDPAPNTEFYRDRTRTIITYNESPDLGFSASLNAYRGCEHGCIYCYARPYHEYLGLSAGLDFETKIFVKENAPELLREELASKKWQPQILMMSGVTDCYQPIERRLKLTRRCLEVLVECRNPVGVITKSALVARDVDLFQELATYKAASVCLSITSLDPHLANMMEPRASSPAARLEAVRLLSAAGVQVSINIAPVIPSINDHEIPSILKAAADAGAVSAGFVLLRLPFGLKGVFDDWLTRHFPDRKEKVLHRLRETQNGKLYDSSWRVRQTGTGEYAEQLMELFRVGKVKAGLTGRSYELSTAAFRRPEGPQLSLFD